MPGSARLEVLQGRPNGVALLICQAPALCAINHNAEDAEETLNPSVAVFQHPNWIIKTAVRFRTDLNRHRGPHHFLNSTIFLYST
jgi:hypothetical protein